MMGRRTQENVVAVALLVLFAGIIWLCRDFGPRARMIPQPLAIFGIVLTVIQILWQNLGSTDALRMDMIKVNAPRKAGTEADEGSVSGAKKPNWRREADAYGIVGALIVLFLALGPIPAVFLFTWGYFQLSGYCSWRAGLIYTTVLTAAIYLLFVVALQMQLYHGLLAPLVERLR
ncbi:MAG: tripartite tricarboxylate transporter TctB family protein [Pseudomonadota bacterium]